MSSLYVYEIFRSISGEMGLFEQGSWVTFIRLAGCNLRCKYCDTKYAQKKTPRQRMNINRICSKVEHDFPDTEQILITGGEPLVQEHLGLYELVSMLKKGHKVSIETNGSAIPNSILMAAVDSWIVDYKLPDSGSCNEMMADSKQYLAFPNVLIKFVCCSKGDCRAAMVVMRRIGWHTHIRFAMSACEPLTHQELFYWMKVEHLWDVGVGFNVQIHKLAGLSESTLIS